MKIFRKALSAASAAAIALTVGTSSIGISGVTNEDALTIQKFKLELIPSLDPADSVA
ncbi:MAG: hypothetical protein NC485_06325 [Ruminococcus flavefaciens]|nr:hypothetical protein [Ruminococcus flavefaciens]MCM1060361.1 hypothetical protein [Eubacterium sp.]